MVKKRKKVKISMLARWRIEPNDPDPVIQKICNENIKIFYKGKDITKHITAIEGIDWSGDDKFGSAYHELDLKIFGD